MANIITAGNSTNGGTAISTDTSGTLNIVTGSGSGSTAVTVDGSQNVSFLGNSLVTSGSSATGYGTGSGGTVTQATNKSTAVTLNKPTGQITMNNAALAANTAVTFVVNNTIVTSTDIVIINAAGGIGGSYRAEAYNPTAGLFVIRVTNITGGSLSEAVILNFAVIKGATA